MISNLFPVAVFLYSHSKIINLTVIGLNHYDQRKKYSIFPNFTKEPIWYYVIANISTNKK